ncbi:MAG: tRNA pseudouridine(55) synthase TruB [Dehalococcoidia bacterium]|nr:tRNA pseudouridine(55) synthase TruB [Dehalococcoidia bacterium]
MRIDGILNLNKPEGKTSFAIVARLKRLTGEKHIGHTGTLDPIATGVLPVCFGQGTRVIQFLNDTSKTYLAEIELGVATDTFDREGEVVQRGDPRAVTAAQIEEVIPAFRGSIQQVPPIYSALKHHGRRYYELARAGIPIRPKPRHIEITSLELVNYELPIMTIKVECGKGTYIRSLAHDLGQCLGCCAHLRNLTRLRSGPFYIENALAPSQIEDAFRQGNWKQIFHAIDSLLLNWRVAIVDKTDELAIRNGHSLPLGEEDFHSQEYCRAYSPDGLFIAVLRFVSEKKVWHPEKVFSL